MKRLTIFPLILFFFCACQKPKGFDYRDVKNVKVQSLGFDKSALSMDLVYFNPNNFGVDLRKVDCDVYVNNSYLGKYMLDTLMHIPGRSEFTLPSRMEVDMKSIYKNVLGVLFSNEVLLNVKGNTRVGKGGIFITVPFNYTGKHQISMFN